MSPVFPEAMERFRSAYAAHRADEGRGHEGSDLLSLPYLRTGPLARQWAVRARSYEALVRHAVLPLERALARPMDVLDLGAGNGWLSYRLAARGHACRAVDIREDRVDGLGAAGEYLRRHPFECIVASFEDLPLADPAADLCVFNASLHYASDLGDALAEAARCTRRGGLIAILDSPFYETMAAGDAMVGEKVRQAKSRFGERAVSLLALPHIEFLTRERLEQASQCLGLSWRRRRVFYPMWYELRPLTALVRGARRPSRFDLWTALLP